MLFFNRIDKFLRFNIHDFAEQITLIEEEFFNDIDVRGENSYPYVCGAWPVAISISLADGAGQHQTTREGQHPDTFTMCETLQRYQRHGEVPHSNGQGARSTPNKTASKGGYG